MMFFCECLEGEKGWVRVDVLKIHMKYIRTKPSWLGNPDQCIQVGSVHVDLTAVMVHNITNARQSLLEHSVGGRIGNHQCGEF